VAAVVVDRVHVVLDRQTLDGSAHGGVAGHPCRRQNGRCSQTLFKAKVAGVFRARRKKRGLGGARGSGVGGHPTAPIIRATLTAAAAATTTTAAASTAATTKNSTTAATAARSSVLFMARCGDLGRGGRPLAPGAREVAPRVPLPP
jgi:hypothetical protein